MIPKMLIAKKTQLTYRILRGDLLAYAIYPPRMELARNSTYPHRATPIFRAIRIAPIKAHRKYRGSRKRVISCLIRSFILFAPWLFAYYDYIITEKEILVKQSSSTF